MFPPKPQECIAARVLYPVVQLVYMHPLGLQPAMVCHVQHGLMLLFDAFLSETNPNPHVNLSYTHLMAWFASHCYGLIPAVLMTFDNEMLPDL